jgi:fructoselysine-6-P-deglycase FrlB-like protein
MKQLNKTPYLVLERTFFYIVTVACGISLHTLMKFFKELLDSHTFLEHAFSYTISFPLQYDCKFCTI